MFKLSDTYYVAPEKLELMYCRSNLIQQIWITGYNNKDYILAFIYPNPEVVGENYSKNKVLEDLQSEIKTIVKENKLLPREAPGQIHILENPLSIEDNTLTSLLKIRRFECRQKFEKEMVQMYSDGPMNYL